MLAQHLLHRLAKRARELYAHVVCAMQLQRLQHCL